MRNIKKMISIAVFCVVSLSIMALATNARAEKIVFASQRDGNGEIYIMNSDGTVQTNLTNDPAEDLDPSLSYDGSKIAFESWRNGNGEIYIMNSDGTVQTNLTNNLAEDYDPSFSPDGSRIAFISNRDGNWEVYVMNADGSNQVNLTNNPADDRVPSFSPDGSKIAFASDRDGNWEIYVINVDGTNPVRLTNNALASNYYPSFSPDGSKIAFTSWRDGNGEIYIMNADGSNQVNLTNNPAGEQFPSSFSPDGSRIAFTSNRDGNWEIYVMNADGSNQIRLTDNSSTDRQPSWGPRTPETTITSAVDGNGAAVASGGSTLSNSITFTFGGTDAVGVTGFQCRLDGAAYAPCASPVGYSALAIGNHTFQVRALDTAGNIDPSPAGFTWAIVTPAQATQNLIITITTLGLPAGVATSLTAPLSNINNKTAACGKLNAFINQVNAKIPPLTGAQATQLLQAANAIKASLGC